MRIGELASRAGTSTRTLRYYESRGLLPARRDHSGYRVYDENDLRLLWQIKTLQHCGFGLEETRPFVECLQAGHPTGDSCPASIDAYRDKIAELDSCIADLRHVRDRLRSQLALSTTAHPERRQPSEQLDESQLPKPLCELSAHAR